MFTVKKELTGFTTVYPQYLSQLTRQFDSEEDAWHDIVINREAQTFGCQWEIADKKQCALALWSILGDVAIDDEEQIEEHFIVFEIGTHREEIWEWFEEYFSLSVAKDLLGF
jgi:hypothetical protein